MGSQIAYHWSPQARRKQIKRYGLMPNKLSTDGLWKPPYVCLALSPMYAWWLSGHTHRGRQIAFWDLWEVCLGEQSGFEELYLYNGEVKELRVYERIYKRNVLFVGSRENIVTRKGHHGE